MLILKSVNFEQQKIHNHQLKQSYPGQSEWMIGRSATCDLVLPNPEVSRTHGQIVYTNGSYHFVDVGSTSGSLLNGKRIDMHDRCPLHPGDLLQLGETFLYVEGLIAPPCAAVKEEVSHQTWSRPEKIWAGEDVDCRCCRIIDETWDVKTFYFVAEPTLVFSYLPGQFVNLELEIDGQTVTRSYSISSSPTRPYHLSLTVKRVHGSNEQPECPPGLVSNWLHDHLKVGDRVKLVGGPMGNFTCLPELPKKLLLISAGSGITPMMSMTRWIQDSLMDCDVVFLHSARTSNDVIFQRELEAIAAQMPNFHLAITTTQQALGRPWMGLTGRISTAMLNLVTPDLLERAVFVCGPESFMRSVRASLESLQFPMQNYKEESFGRTFAKPFPVKATAGVTSPSKALSHDVEPTTQIMNGHALEIATDASAKSTVVPTRSLIHFVKSGQHVPVDPGSSILEAAEQAGIQIRYACRAGVCGACKIQLRQGQVHYDSPPAALSAADQEAGYVLACVACPSENVEIEA